MTKKEISNYLQSQNGIYSVKNFGAVGDGSADDTDAFGEADAAMPSHGGTLLIPPGDYIVSSTFEPTKPILMIGCGKGVVYAGSGVDVVSIKKGSRILYTGTDSPAIYANGNPFDARDFSLIYAGAEPSVGNAAISINNCGNPSLQNMGMVDFYDALKTVDLTFEYDFNRLIIIGVYRYGILLDAPTNYDFGDGNITSCIIRTHKRPATAGIYFLAGGGAKISSLKINGDGSNAFDRGIDINSSRGHTCDTNIVNASIEGMRYEGIRFQNGSHQMREIIISAVQIGYHGAAQSTPAISITGPNSYNSTIGNITVSGAGSSSLPVIRLTDTESISIGPISKNDTFGEDVDVVTSDNIKTNNPFYNLPEYADEAAADAGGLEEYDPYRTADGDVMVKLAGDGGINFETTFLGASGSVPVADIGTILATDNFEVDGSGNGQLINPAAFGYVRWQGELLFVIRVTLESVSSIGDYSLILTTRANSDFSNRITFYLIRDTSGGAWYLNVFKKTAGVDVELIPPTAISAPIAGDVWYCKVDATNVTTTIIGQADLVAAHGAAFTDTICQYSNTGSATTISRILDQDT